MRPGKEPERGSHPWWGRLSGESYGLSSHMCTLFGTHVSILDALVGMLGQVQLQVICVKAGMTRRVHSEPFGCSDIRWDVCKQATLAQQPHFPVRRDPKSGVLQSKDQPSPAQSEVKLQAISLVTQALRVDLQGKWIQKTSKSLLSKMISLDCSS